MTGKQRKNLVRLRLVLSVIAVLLAGVMVLSGVMHFVVGAPVSQPEPTTQPTETTQSTTVATELESTEVSTTAEALETMGVPQDELPVTQVGTDGKGNTQVGIENSAAGEKTKPEETDPTETDPTETDPTETDPTETDPTETDPTETDPTETDPTETDPTETDPTETDPTETDPTETDPTETDPTGTEPTGTEPAGTEPDGTDSTETAAFTETTLTTETDAAAEDATVMATEQYFDPMNQKEIEEENGGIPWGLLFWGSSALLALDLVAILVLSYCIRADKKRLAAAANARTQATETVDTTTRTETLKWKQTGAAAPTGIGTVHQMGAREYQQDSMGYMAVLNDRGMLAVVADGMGGLSGGEKVSREIVMNMLGLAQRLNAAQVNGVLWKMVNQVNEDVNRMLGPDGLYKSGSTLVSVLVYEGKFQWVAVGDSRIYLYRQGYANQLNRDHDQLQAWMPEVLEGKRSMEEVLRNPDGRKLTSFIGMGQLKHVDGSVMPIALEAGDRLVLMSDGIYNTINEDWLAAILQRYPDVNQAASAIERAIKEANHPHQDNFTAIVLGF